jgi:hypothetical protein
MSGEDILGFIRLFVYSFMRAALGLGFLRKPISFSSPKAKGFPHKRINK